MAKGIFCTSLRPMFAFLLQVGERVCPIHSANEVASPPAGEPGPTGRKSCRVPGTHQSDVHGKRRQEWMPWKACLGDTWARPVYDIFVACLGGGGGGGGMPFAAVHAHGLANPAGEATVPGQSNRPFPGQPDSATRSRGTPLVVTASWPAIAQIKTVDVIGDVAACGIWFASGGGGGSQQGSARVVRRGRL